MEASDRSMEDELYRRALRDERAGRFLEALEGYRAYVERQPDDPKGHNKVGAILARLGRRGEARAHFLEALRLDRTFVPAMANLGGLALEEGNLEEAERWLTEALRLDPEYPPAQNNLGVLHRRRGNITAMVGSLKAAARAERRRMRQEAQEDLRSRFGCLTGPAALLLLGLALLHWH
jgi:tetratricopeptide (TPR) repeat protein